MARLYMAKVLDRASYTLLTAQERREIMKMEQAKENSGLRRYPTTCAAVFDRIPPEYIHSHTAAQIGELARMLYRAYQDGKAEGERYARTEEVG